MKYVFTSLLCHRDVKIFKFNWFCQRIHLDCGFDIPHIILSDGSLTDEDRQELESLPNVLVEEHPIVLHIGSDGKQVPKAPLLGKLQCLQRCFENHGADRAVLFDCDIFFFRNWESDLRKILTERAVVLRDWGSSIGPNREEYKALFGVTEDESTPNGNTGVISFDKEDWHRVEETVNKHLSNTFMMMEDQGAMVAAFHGILDYANGIKCVINGAEGHPQLWPFFKRQNAVHLMGMRTRAGGLCSCVEYSLSQLPDSLHIKQFTPIEKFISFGLLEFDHYSFAGHLQKIPSSVDGNYANNAMYMHGGSRVRWKMPPRCSEFHATLVCMDTGIPKNVAPVMVNGQRFRLNEEIVVPLNGFLNIETQDGPGAHIAFLNPKIMIDKTTWPDLSKQQPDS
jgi:hypothetical protein